MERKSEVPEVISASPQPPAVSVELTSAQRKRNWIIALLMLLTYVVVTVTTGQFTNYVFTDTKTKFNAPYLFTWFKMAFRTILFPLFLLINTAIKMVKGRKVDLPKTIRRCKAIFGPEGLSLKNVTFKLVPPAITMLIHQLTYTFSMAYLTTSIATALYSLAVAISYLLSWLVLKHPLLLVKCVFVLVSFAGVSLIAYAGFTGQASKNALVGVICTIISVFALCFHQLTFKKAFPVGDLGQVSFALVGVYLVITLIFWPIPLILKLTGIEVYDISLMPYSILIPTWFMSAVNSTAYGYGLVLSSPYFMSIGELLVLAANSGVDAYVRHLQIHVSQIVGTVLVAVAFIIMILPDHLLSLPIRERLFTKPKLLGSHQLGNMARRLTLPVLDTLAEISHTDSPSNDSYVNGPDIEQMSEMEESESEFQASAARRRSIVGNHELGTSRG